MTERIIGFSTGCLYKNIKDPNSYEGINLIKNSGANAIEFCCINLERLQNFYRDINSDDLNCFKYKSLHMPDGFLYGENEKTYEVLDLISKIHKKHNFNNFVIHPFFIENIDVFNKYSEIPFLFENDDNRKNSANSIKYFENFFNKNPSFNMIFDIMHAYSFGFDEVKKYLNASFSDKIKQYHISGFKNHNDGTDNCNHYPIYLTHQTEMLENLIEEIPLIIESVFPIDFNLKEGLEKELKYLKNKL